MSEFVDYLHEVFEHFGPIRTRKMFGAHGIYHNELMFGLVADDQFYLKTDSASVGLFEERGLGPFEYVAKTKTSTLSYYLAPEEIYDDPEQAAYWAELGFQAALRSNSANAKRVADRKAKKNQEKGLSLE